MIHSRPDNNSGGNAVEDPARTALTDAIDALLTPIHTVITDHTSDHTHRCTRCRLPQPCPGLDTATDALGLVIRTHHTHLTPPTPNSRHPDG